MDGLWILVMLMSYLLTVWAQDVQLALVGEDVHLHCSCPANEKHPYLVWQINKTIVDQYVPDIGKEGVDQRFKGRTYLYLPKNKGNCSLLLRNVSVTDEHTYTCYYLNGDIVEKQVTLQVAANYTIQVEKVSDTSQKSPRTGNYSCQAWGGYPQGRLFWMLNGEPVQVDSVSDHKVRDSLSQLYTLTSTRFIDMTGDSILQCVVENPRLHLNFTASAPTNSFVLALTNSPATPTLMRNTEKNQAVSIVPITVVVLICIMIIAILLIRHHRKQHLTDKAYAGVSHAV